mgnify:CR=1 FL=1
MTNQGMEFQSFTSGETVGSSHRTFAGRSLIARDTVRLDEPVKIAFEDLTPEEGCGESIHPIEEDGVVVGVIHVCSCGRTTEIRFEYERPI